MKAYLKEIYAKIYDNNAYLVCKIFIVISYMPSLNFILMDIVIYIIELIEHFVFLFIIKNDYIHYSQIILYINTLEYKIK